MTDEIKKIASGPAPKTDPKNRMINPINAIFTKLFPIKEVKNRFCGLVIKNWALFAAGLFFWIPIFIRTLFAVINTVSEAAKNALKRIEIRSRIKIRVMKFQY